jgi:transcriptional regulator with XRE-family HTH domain
VTKQSSNDPFKELGDYLKKKRIAKNLTQKDVAMALKYDSAQFVSNIERGLCSLPLSKIPTIMELYDIDLTTITKILLQVQKKIIAQTIEASQSRRSASRGKQQRSN